MVPEELDHYTAGTNTPDHTDPEELDHYAAGSAFPWSEYAPATKVRAEMHSGSLKQLRASQA